MKRSNLSLLFLTQGAISPCTCKLLFVKATKDSTSDNVTCWNRQDFQCRAHHITTDTLDHAASEYLGYSDCETCFLDTWYCLERLIQITREGREPEAVERAWGSVGTLRVWLKTDSPAEIALRYIIRGILLSLPQIDL